MAAAQQERVILFSLLPSMFSFSEWSGNLKPNEHVDTLQGRF